MIDIWEILKYKVYEKYNYFNYIPEFIFLIFIMGLYVYGK